MEHCRSSIADCRWLASAVLLMAACHDLPSPTSVEMAASPTGPIYAPIVIQDQSQGGGVGWVAFGETDPGTALETPIFWRRFDVTTPYTFRLSRTAVTEDVTWLPDEYRTAYCGGAVKAHPPYRVIGAHRRPPAGLLSVVAVDGRRVVDRLIAANRGTEAKPVGGRAAVWQRNCALAFSTSTVSNRVPIWCPPGCSENIPNLCYTIRVVACPGPSVSEEGLSLYWMGNGGRI